LKSRSDLFALIGAGPSLNYCDAELADLASRGAHFLVSDSAAAAVLRRFTPKAATVFTVELRRHAYLSRIDSSAVFDVLAYKASHARNLRFSAPRIVSRFKLLGEGGEEQELYSPGTVLGTMFSFAVTSLPAATGEIHLLGADFSYIDNQVYSRYIAPHMPPFHRLASQEKWQFEMALKKSSAAIVLNGHAIRTSFELAESRKNLSAFAAKLPATIALFDYSPLGIDAPTVRKAIPASLSANN
jgi:hypothetical protein